MTILIKDIDLIPVDGKENLIKKTNIYIERDKIIHIGGLREDIELTRIIDGKNKLAMPGLVNAHTHIGMSLPRNYADDLPLHDWLTKALLSLVEMIQS